MRFDGRFVSDQTLERAQTVRKGRGSWLQNQRGLDLVKAAVADRRDRVEARASGDSFSVELFAAPRADDDIGRAQSHLLNADGAFLRRFTAGAISENVDSAGDLN